MAVATFAKVGLVQSIEGPHAARYNGIKALSPHDVLGKSLLVVSEGNVVKSFWEDGVFAVSEGVGGIDVDAMPDSVEVFSGLSAIIVVVVVWDRSRVECFDDAFSEAVFNPVSPDLVGATRDVNGGLAVDQVKIKTIFVSALESIEGVGNSSEPMHGSYNRGVVGVAKELVNMNGPVMPILRVPQVARP